MANEHTSSTLETPEITFDQVEPIFGHNLDTNDPTLKKLLLAIGMDHTSKRVPFSKHEIGVPYIVSKGPAYWVSQLKHENNNLDVIVNNALLLLFTKSTIPKGREFGVRLMRQAAQINYWPAEYFIAETDLTNLVAAPDSTFARFQRCAKIGFAPCQFRVGFWLAREPETLKDGVHVLRNAINITLKDKRYSDILNTTVVRAAKEIIRNGDKVNLSLITQEMYASLIADLLKSSQNK